MTNIEMLVQVPALANAIEKDVSFRTEKEMDLLRHTLSFSVNVPDMIGEEVLRLLSTGAIDRAGKFSPRVILGVALVNLGENLLGSMSKSEECRNLEKF